MSDPLWEYIKSGVAGCSSDSETTEEARHSRTGKKKA